MAAPRPPGPRCTEGDETARLHAELGLLRARVRRLEAELRALAPLATAVRETEFWDPAPYEIWPGPEWVAAGRTDVEHLLGTLAGIDHWRPWHVELERRPLP